MYAGVVTVQIRPGKLGGTIGISRDVVAPALVGLHGFAGGRLLPNPATGRGVMLTLWESEADLRALEASGWFQEEVARFQAVLGAPPSREDSEVSGWFQEEVARFQAVLGAPPSREDSEVSVTV